MSENTKIEWADHTFNPWIGCTKVSPGCDNCYAEAREDKRLHRVQWGPGQPRHRTKTWGDPVRWNKGHDAFFAQHGRRQRVFCASLADVFDNEVDPAWRAELFALIACTPNLDWLLLTKRIGNVARMIEAPGMQKCGLPSNVWLGITIVNQPEADRDITKLLAVQARVRFLSMEPLLGAVDLTPHLWGRPDPCDDCPKDADCICGYARRGTVFDDPALHWVIVGGESGHNARPMHISWARSIVKQCKDAGVPVHVKQLGAQPRGWCAAQVHSDDPDREDDACDFYEAHEFGAPCPGRCAAMVHKKGSDISEWPEDLRVREFPQ